MKKLLSALAVSALTIVAQAQNYGQDCTLKIWDNNTAPHTNGITTPETEPGRGQVGNTSEAALYLFRAAPDKATGAAVVICPGGGYARLCMDYEGWQAARWFADNGVTAAVLKYRMPAGHPEVPLEDVEQALRIMSGAVPGAEGFTSDRVGVAGFSAGGHLAAMASTLAEHKPAFAILFYPVITGEAGKSHKGSFDRLLGENRSEAATASYSLHNRVTSATPPTLLLLSNDDRTVSPVSSTRYYEALQSNGVEASMHIYPSGGHGWGFRDNFRYRIPCREALLEWLSRH